MVASTQRLAPGFLVAAPGLTDPSFRESVVLLVDHGPEGSLGFVRSEEHTSELQSLLII